MSSWMTGSCDTRGANLHYARTGGAGQPLVLLHGLTGSGACWSPSPVVSMETASELRDLNPRVRVEQIQGAGHGLPYDQPERLAAVVRSFTSSNVPVFLERLRQREPGGQL